MELDVPVLNTTGEIIPGFGLMRRTGVNNDGQITVAKPNVDGQFVLVNGPFPILANKVGMAGYHLRSIIAYDAQDGTPAHGETWGAANGSWLARKGRAGFQIDGGAHRGVVNAVRPAGLPPTHSFEAVASGYGITADNTWEDTGPVWDVALPSGGVYELIYRFFSGAEATGSVGPPNFYLVHYRLWDETASAEVAGSVTAGSVPTASGVRVYNPVSMVIPFTAASARTIRLEARRYGGPTWVVSGIFNGESPRLGAKGYMKW